MSTYSEWIQPDDMWVPRPLAANHNAWYRVLAFNNDGTPAENIAQLWTDRWQWLLNDATVQFAGRQNGLDVVLAQETVGTSPDTPSAHYQSLPYSTHQNQQLFSELAGPLSVDDYPQYDPPREPGVGVEYEADEGEYFDTHRFQVPWNAVVNASNQNSPRLAYVPSGGIVSSGDYPTPGASFLGWDRTAALTGSFGTTTITVESRVLTLTLLFHPHLAGGPQAGTRGGTVYLGRHNAQTPRPFSVVRRYRPSRYRLVFPSGGVPPLRHRQNALNSGGSPLRHRQNGGQTGGSPLRHRQNGI